MDKSLASSNLQGLENEKPIPQGKPEEVINYNSEERIPSSEHQSTGEIVKEKSDIYRLQDEDFRARVQRIESNSEDPTNDSANNQQSSTQIFEWDPAVHPDGKSGRLHLSIQYDDEKNQLIVQILDAQGMIRSDQIYASDMRLTFSLIANDRTEQTSEKHERIFVDHAPVQWKEPMIFCTKFDQVIQENLYILATNDSDPTAPRDREIFIPMKNLKFHAEPINEWFNLQFVPSRS